MDPTLVRQAQAGDRDAFARLVGLVSGRLHAVALRIMRDPDAAGDVLQAALVDIWRDLPKLREPERFDAWAYRVIVNRCRAELRGAKRRPATVGLVPTDGGVDDAQLSVGVRDALDRAFGRLSADQRAVLVLVYYQDLSVAQAAETLGIAEGTVKSRLHAGRAALRAAVEADERQMRSEGSPA